MEAQYVSAAGLPRRLTRHRAIRRKTPTPPVARRFQTAARQTQQTKLIRRALLKAPDRQTPDTGRAIPQDWQLLVAVKPVVNLALCRPCRRARRPKRSHRTGSPDVPRRPTALSSRGDRGRAAAPSRSLLAPQRPRWQADQRRPERGRISGHRPRGCTRTPKGTGVSAITDADVSETSATKRGSTYQ